MPGRVHVQNILKELGFSYDDTTDRCQVYKRGELRVYMRRKDQISEEWLRQTLRQAGVTPPEIEAYVRTCNQ